MTGLFWRPRFQLSQQISNLFLHFAAFQLSPSQNTDLTSRDADLKELNVDATRAKELDKVVQRQTSELEQLKKQLSEQQQSKHGAEENSKIEIRNLQNALDSSKKESEAQHANVAEFKKQIEDLRKQLVESQQLTKAANATSGDSFLVSIRLHHSERREAQLTR